jgi:hypothetical protein
MNGKAWLIALAALVLGAAGAVAITRGAQEDTGTAAAPGQATQTESTPDQQQEQQKKKKKQKAAEADEPAEQEVKVTVDGYIEAVEQGDTDALCAIQTEALAAQACAQAAEGSDWAELRAAWASQIDLEQLKVDVNGGQASVSVAGGASFSLDRQRSGEWKIDGFTPPSGGGRSVPTRGGGSVPTGGGSVELPAPQRPQLPQR